MPMGFGMHAVMVDPFYSILWMIIWMVIIAVIVGIVVYFLISPLRKQPNVDNEKLIKIEKDVEEIKEIVKELKKKWEEIE